MGLGLYLCSAVAEIYPTLFIKVKGVFNAIKDSIYNICSLKSPEYKYAYEKEIRYS